MTDEPSSLDTVLEAARDLLQSRRAEANDRVERIKAAAELYLSAMEQEIALEFALRNGLPLPLRVDGTTNRPKPVRAALDLRAAVETLPELRVRVDSASTAAAATMTMMSGSAAHASAQPASSSPNVEEGRTEGPRSEPRPRDGRGTPDPDPDVVELTRDMQLLGFDAMPLALFRAHAEELAARARALQDRGPEAEELTSRVIRRLTALAYEKGIADVYGLNRKHMGDWDGLAARARARREALQSAPAKPRPSNPEAAKPEPDAESSKSSPTESGQFDVVKVPDAATTQISRPVPIEVESAPVSEPEPASIQLPRLLAACDRGPVVMVGGIVKPDKVQAIRERFGVDIEWVDTSRSGNNTIGSVEKRIREKRLAAVIVLQGLISHKHFEPLVGAARQVNLPFAYADKAGTGSVGRALAEIERALARKDELAS